VASRRVNQDLPVIARFEVRHRNYLAPDGSIARPLPAFASDANLLIALYRAVVLLRLFDKKGPMSKGRRRVCPKPVAPSPCEACGARWPNA